VDGEQRKRGTIDQSEGKLKKNPKISCAIRLVV